MPSLASSILICSCCSLSVNFFLGASGFFSFSSSLFRFRFSYSNCFRVNHILKFLTFFFRSSRFFRSSKNDLNCWKKITVPYCAFGLGAFLFPVKEQDDFALYAPPCIFCLNLVLLSKWHIVSLLPMRIFSRFLKNTFKQS